MRKGLSLSATGKRSSHDSPWRNYPSAVLTSGKFKQDRPAATSWWIRYALTPRDGSFYAEAVMRHPQAKA